MSEPNGDQAEAVGGALMMLRDRTRPLPRSTPDRIGRVQLQIRRALIASGGKPLQMSDLLPRCYPRVKNFKEWHRWNIRRAAPKVAARIGKEGNRVIWGPMQTQRETVR